MPIPGTNIRLLRRERPLTLHALAEAVGMTTSNLSRLERGEQGTSAENMEKIAKVLGVSVSVLYSDNAVVEGAVLRVRKAPLLTAEQLGEWTGPDTEDFPDNHPYQHIDLERASRHVFAFRVGDRTNEPTLQPGDVGVFDAAKQPAMGDVVIAQDRAGQVFLGRLRKLVEGEDKSPLYEIVPHERLYPVISPATAPGLQIRGTLVELRRPFL